MGVMLVLVKQIGILLLIFCRRADEKLKKEGGSSLSSMPNGIFVLLDF